MFEFKFEAALSLLTVTRTGTWSVGTVASYEPALRRELTKLYESGRPTSFIIDIRSTGAQAADVAEALRAMVAGLGHLHPDRTAVVTASGIAKLQAKYVADPSAQVFTSMILARDWITNQAHSNQPPSTVHDEASEADAEGITVHIHGPSDVDVTMTPAAALETAKRISSAAGKVVVEATPAPAPNRLAA